MRRRMAYLRYRWRRVPPRIRMGAVIAVMAVAGLSWQHHTDAGTPTPPQAQRQAAPAAGPVLDDHAAVSTAPGAPSELPGPVDVSTSAARVTAERFATNYATPSGDRDGWLARLTPDVSPELLDQYQSTDISTVPQAAVSQVSGPMGADPGVTTFQVDYDDGSRLEMTLELGEAGWTVSSVIPVEHAAPPAPDTTPTVLAPGVIPLVASAP